MRKIPTLFVRDPADMRRVTPTLSPGCEWVQAGEGRATAKYDGTAIMVRDGSMYQRFDAKRGRDIPYGFEPCQDPDAVTGHWPGWVPLDEGNAGKWAREVFKPDTPNGTYELCGPKVNKNKHRFESHVLIPHGALELPNAPNTFEGLSVYLATLDFEGIV